MNDGQLRQSGGMRAGFIAVVLSAIVFKPSVPSRRITGWDRPPIARLVAVGVENHHASAVHGNDMANDAVVSVPGVVAHGRRAQSVGRISKFRCCRT